MGKIQNIFKSIDSFIFNKIDLMLDQPAWQQVADRFRLLSENQQKYLNHIISLLLVMLPIVLVLFLSMLNYSASDALDMKKKIVETITTITDKKNEFNGLERDRLSRTSVNSKEDASKMLSTSLGRKGIDTSKITVKHFENQSSGTSVNISRIVFEFKNFSSADLSNTFSALADREKATIPSLKIRKDTKTNSLNGTIEITHYSRGQ